MRSAKPTFALAAALIAATTLHAQDARHSSGSMMGGGMMGGGMMRGGMMGGGVMGGGGMMGSTSQMMDHCTGMMSGHEGGNRPNDQWRRNAPTAPDKDR